MKTLLVVILLIIATFTLQYGRQSGGVLSYKQNTLSKSNTLSRGRSARRLNTLAYPKKRFSLRHK
jgi:hypothetical protein